MLPPLPTGYTARTGTLADAPAAAALSQAFSLAVSDFSDLDAEALLNEWQTPRFDPSQDVYLVFAPDGEMVGYTEIWTLSQPPVHPFVYGVVHIEHHGLGIGTHMLAWAEQRALQLLPRIPPEARLAPLASLFAGHAPSQQLFEERGYRHFRSLYVMLNDFTGPAPDFPSFPAHLTLRTFQPEHARALYAANEDAFSDHFGHVEQPFEEGFARFENLHIHDPLFDPSLWWTLWDGDEIAGLCLCRAQAPAEPGSAYVAFLGVRRAWRQRGLGLALLQHALAEFQRRGAQKVMLNVDASSLTGALRIYERAGFRIISQSDLYEKELRPGVELRKE
jgi:ribosomal protein S18 acetylase RimI-like enzyme